jgi:hypothetical protein
MFRRVFTLGLFFSGVVLPLVGISEESMLNRLSEQEVSAGWQLLFDGKSLSGWSSYDATRPIAWEVRDGRLSRKGGAFSGDLMTNEEFADFELTFDWCIGVGGNSGVIYRADIQEKKAILVGPEYQLLDNSNARDRLQPTHRAGALYDLVAPLRNVSYPAEQWNSSRIIVKGWRLEHWLNGTCVVKTDLSDPAGRKLIAGSKFKEHPRYATLLRGHIVLQDHQSSVEFRNLKIRRIVASLKNDFVSP